MHFTQEDFEQMFRLEHGSMPDWIATELDGMDTTYHTVSPDERQEYELFFESVLNSPSILRSKEEAIAAFEHGWTENYEAIKRNGINLNGLKPGYFRGNKFLRFHKSLIVSTNLQLEFELFQIARRILFDKYLKNQALIWELGCGSCENLLMLAEQFPGIKLRGADWTCASKRIADYMGKKLNRDISGFVYDMSTPNGAPVIEKGAAITTIHAFEQLGNDFSAALNLILDAKPSIVFQYEPVLDFYDPKNRYDAFALRYCLKRNYLNGYYNALKRLEKEGKIQILAAFRPELGGVLHEHSVLVWKMNNGVNA